MKTGVELISLERTEQIEKHHRDMGSDVVINNLGQLKHAAISLLQEPACYRIIKRPYNWNEHIWLKMCNKPYKERLIIAGALIAAEIDRIQNK